MFFLLNLTLFRYRQRAKQLGDQVRDTPMTPVETAVWWIEYAIRNRGAEHLKYKGAKISLFEYFLLDVILLHVFVLILIVLLIVFLVKTCLNVFTGGSSKKLKKKIN